MREDVPKISCSSANGGVAIDRTRNDNAKRSSDECKELYDEWSEIADDVIEQYDEALRLLSK